MAAALADKPKFHFSKCWQSLSILKKAGWLTAVGQRCPGPKLDLTSNKALLTLCSLCKRQPVRPPSRCLTPVLRSSHHSAEGFPLQAPPLCCSIPGDPQARPGSQPGYSKGDFSFQLLIPRYKFTWHRLPEVFPTSLGQKEGGSGWKLKDNMWGSHLQVLEMKKGTV